MAITKGNKRRAVRTKRNISDRQKKTGVRVSHRGVVAIRVRRSSGGKYAYLYQEDRELDNAIRTMKRMLGEID